MCVDVYGKERDLNGRDGFVGGVEVYYCGV